MPVDGATKGGTLRPSGNPALLFVQVEDPDGQLGDEPIYRIMRADEHGRPSIMDHPDPANVQLFTDQDINATAEVNSQDDGNAQAPIDCSSYRNFSLELAILSTNSPTDIEFFVEFSNNGGTTWKHYAQGLFASLVYSDLSVATLRDEIFTGLVVGDMFRLRVVGVGTDGTDIFTFSALVRFWR